MGARERRRLSDVHACRDAALVVVYYAESEMSGRFTAREGIKGQSKGWPHQRMAIP